MQNGKETSIAPNLTCLYQNRTLKITGVSQIAIYIERKVKRVVHTKFSLLQRNKIMFLLVANGSNRYHQLANLLHETIHILKSLTDSIISFYDTQVRHACVYTQLSNTTPLKILFKYIC